MGACFDGRIYRTENKDEIKKKWASAVSTSEYEDGHSYSGAIGMLGSQIARWHDKQFENENAAWEWLEDTHQKWKPGEAVSFFYIDPQTKEKKLGWLVGGLCSS